MGGRAAAGLHAALCAAPCGGVLHWVPGDGMRLHTLGCMPLRGAPTRSPPRPAAPPRPCPACSAPVIALTNVQDFPTGVTYSITVTPATTSTYDYPKGGWAYYKITVMRATTTGVTETTFYCT